MMSDDQDAYDHLFGYDHMEEVERKEMEMHQKKIMELVNITR